MQLEIRGRRHEASERSPPIATKIAASIAKDTALISKVTAALRSAGIMAICTITVFAVMSFAMAAPAHADSMTEPHHQIPPLLSARGLRFARNDEPVFGPLDFAVDAGEALLVRGDNGAGKTTLLRVLAGLLRPDEGTIEIDGHQTDAPSRTRVIAYLGHLPALKSDLSALENLNFLCGLHGRRRAQTPASAMAIVGLGGYEDHLARQLSAGQKKRLSLARMWLSPAPLWLLDEPYANLDLDGIDLVNRMVQAHLREGGAALVTTHGAYAAPPVRTRELVIRRPGMPEGSAA
jgi:heme exporter protein A